MSCSHSSPSLAVACGSDWVIALSYYAIPIQILYFLHKYPTNVPIRYRIVIFLFALFIVLCGSTHLISVTLMDSAESPNASSLMSAAKFLTALISFITMIALFFIIPNALNYLLLARGFELAMGDNIKELAHANEEARLANTNKSEFMAFLSHEIRNLLHVITANVDFLSETQLKRDQSDFVSSIGDSVSLMASLVNDVLDISRLQSGKMAFEAVPIDLLKICNSIVNNSQSQASSKSIKFLLEWDDRMPRFVVSDPTRISQMLMNLSSNAIKFTKTGSVKLRVNLISNESSESDDASPEPAHGLHDPLFNRAQTTLAVGSSADQTEIEFVQESTEHAKQTVRDEIGSDDEIQLHIIEENESNSGLSHISLIQFEIVDTGVGISKEEIPRLFNPYSQAKLSTQRLFGGSGLGCKP